VWPQPAPKVSLSPPSPEARRNLVALQVDSDEQGGKGQVEYFRRDRSGGVSDTQFRLVSREEASTSFEPREERVPTIFERWRWPWEAQPQPARPQTGGGFFGGGSSSNRNRSSSRLRAMPIRATGTHAIATHVTSSGIATTI